LVAGCVAAASAGCKPPVQPQQFLSRHAVLSSYNARAESIQRLWSRCHIVVDMPKFDDAGTSVTGRESYAADGHFIFDKPRNLLLQGKAPFVGAVFGLHSNDQQYWFWVKPKTSTEWKGRHGGPGQERLLLRPDRLLETLGMFAVPTDGRAMFRRDPDTDVIQVVAESPLPSDAHGGFASMCVVQEIHLDRYKHDPVSVRLLDPSGEPIVVSTLSNYREVEGVRVPGTLVFRFLLLDPVRNETVVTLDLKDITLTKELPSSAFAYREPPVDAHVDVDAPSFPRAAPRNGQ
jgi:hypothetical protein